MEQEEKKAKRASGSRTTSTTKKETSATKTKTTTKKVTSAKETPSEKTNSTRKTTVATKKSEPTKKTTRTRTTKSAEVQAPKATEPKITRVPKKAEVNKPTEVKKEENKIKENNNEKRYIDISVGAIICAIVIIALLILNIKLGKHAYGILKNQTTNSDVEPEKNVSVTQEIGNVIEKTSDIASQMKEKITFPSNVVASIYNTKGFDNTTITNELKLMLGWAKTDIGNKLVSRNENNEEVESLESSQMSKTIKEILGNDVKYIDEAFNNTRISTFENSTRSKGEIAYNNGLYKSVLQEEKVDIQPLIYQEIQRVVKYSDKVNVYVKVAFVDVFGGNCQIYKNFKNNKFSDKVKELSLEELFKNTEINQYTGEGTVTLEENSALDAIRTQLNTYKYTFVFDEETQGYYLSKFAKGTN